MGVEAEHLRNQGPHTKATWPADTSSRHLYFQRNVRLARQEGNAANKIAFTPHRVPNTQQVRIKLGQLKRNLFPKLEINEFITGGRRISANYGPVITS